MLLAGITNGFFQIESISYLCTNRTIMKAITFKSSSMAKLNSLIKVAEKMGIEKYTLRELTDEEMALPGSQPSVEQLEEWLAKEDGVKYSLEEAFERVHSELARSRKKKK